jgi:hypothetical protein
MIDNDPGGVFKDLGALGLTALFALRDVADRMFSDQ